MWVSEIVSSLRDRPFYSWFQSFLRLSNNSTSTTPDTVKRTLLCVVSWLLFSILFSCGQLCQVVHSPFVILMENLLCCPILFYPIRKRSITITVHPSLRGRKKKEQSQRWNDRVFNRGFLPLPNVSAKPTVLFFFLVSTVFLCLIHWFKLCVRQNQPKLMLIGYNCITLQEIVTRNTR